MLGFGVAIFIPTGSVLIIRIAIHGRDDRGVLVAIVIGDNGSV